MTVTADHGLSVGVSILRALSSVTIARADMAASSARIGRNASARALASSRFWILRAQTAEFDVLRPLGGQGGHNSPADAAKAGKDAMGCKVHLRPSLTGGRSDDVPSRRLRLELLTSEQALEQARAFARTERLANCPGASPALQGIS
jgi:hypothetical protein